MSGYKVVHSVRLKDPQGGLLDIILETNDRSWKVFARHRPEPGMEPRESGWSNFPTEQLGKEGFERSVQMAYELGWRENCGGIGEGQ